MPHPIRFPSNRFIFFLDHLEDKYLKVKSPNRPPSQQELFVRPHWIALNDQRLLFSPRKLSLRFDKLVRDASDYRNSYFW